MKILVTGGAGYIGSHTTVELLNAGHEVVIVDNLCNSSKKSLERVKKITGKAPKFYKIDIRDAKKLNAMLDKEAPFDATIHFAALKAVGESTQIPLKYYNNNLGGTFNLLKCLADHDCKNIVFSSSATVYGEPKSVPIRENFPTPGCTNPYGWTKLMMEQVFKDVQKADPTWNVILLRYFNPIGAHESGLIGEDPAGIPNNLLPYVAQVAVGRRPHLNVFGDDYPTPDGTGVRDYILVVELALGHLKAIQKLGKCKNEVCRNQPVGRYVSHMQGLAVCCIFGRRQANGTDGEQQISHCGNQHTQTNLHGSRRLFALLCKSTEDGY